MGWRENPVLTLLWRHSLSPRRLHRSLVLQIFLIPLLALLSLEVLAQTAELAVAADVIAWFLLLVGPLVSVWIVMGMATAVRRLCDKGMLEQVAVTPIPGGMLVWSVALPTIVAHLVMWTVLNRTVYLFAHRLVSLGHNWNWPGMIYSGLTWTLVACLAHIPLCAAVSLRAALRSRGNLLQSLVWAVGLSVLYVSLFVAWMIVGDTMERMGLGVFLFPCAWLAVSWGVSWVLISTTARRFHAICRPAEARAGSPVRDGQSPA